MVELPIIKYQMTKYGTVEGLMKYININSLIETHKHMSNKKASGIDNINKLKYDTNLVANLNKLLDNMKKFEYYPKAVKRVFIPKTNKKVRRLAISAYEDKLVQKLMNDILNNIYENIFLNCSYGFRPNKNCHQAILEIINIIENGKINYIVETDIEGFFDNLNHNKLIYLLKIVIKDKHFIKYIHRFLKTEIKDKNIFTITDKGAPQGGNISPILANVYLHYALDQWFYDEIKNNSKGKCYLIRYADDFIMLFETYEDSIEVLNKLKLRLNKFDLNLQKDKTKICNFSINKINNNTINFLGFSIYNYYSQYHNDIKIGVKIKEENIYKKEDKIKMFIQNSKYTNIYEVTNNVNSILRGYYNYYGINTNYDWLLKIYQFTQRELLKLYIERYGIPRNEQEITYLEYKVKTLPLETPKISIYL